MGERKMEMVAVLGTRLQPLWEDIGGRGRVGFSGSRDIGPQ